MQVSRWLTRKWFSYIHSKNLVYNACWEDPRLDRTAMNLGSDSSVVMITSGGCNALDYALDRPKKISAIDLNPWQNALLDLKIAGIRALDYPAFFSLFGNGHLENFAEVYRWKLRPQLRPYAQDIWDRHKHYFENAGGMSFYYRGTSGFFARLINYYVDWKEIRHWIHSMFQADSIEAQQQIYTQWVREVLWSRKLQQCMNWDVTLSLLGVPRTQKTYLQQVYQGKVSDFMKECVGRVCTLLSLKDNYFWWLYFNGSYTPDRCPQYLTPDGFQKLKNGAVDCIQTHTCSLESFCASSEQTYSHYVLLDHMDWIADDPSALSREWQGIVDTADSKGARILFRSGGSEVSFLNPTVIKAADSYERLGDLLQYHPRLSEQLHSMDRVHTYGSFHVADLQVV